MKLRLATLFAIAASIALLGATNARATAVRVPGDYGLLSNTGVPVDGGTSGTTDSDGLTEWVVCTNSNPGGPCSSVSGDGYTLLLEVPTTTSTADMTLDVSGIDVASSAFLENGGNPTSVFGVIQCPSFTSSGAIPCSTGLPTAPGAIASNCLTSLATDAPSAGAIAELTLPGDCLSGTGETVFYLDLTSAPTAFPVVGGTVSTPETGTLGMLILAMGVIGLLFRRTVVAGRI